MSHRLDQLTAFVAGSAAKYLPNEAVKCVKIPSAASLLVRHGCREKKKEQRKMAYVGRTI
ncbi:hypothetical protein BKA82DRAFT_1007434 [Pisolithus tinctorius]|uniref:Uncharacterized protein n=1 Tax=Pisolithus tinctorius Marx 270 TaxID=870435 RepID=A0A0C3JCR5_PISTI|nr:hypothetical protein BKA82DRAFT_1007434 [Pisolithus tinctorius]KIN95471.1 hypothetical protein M404DRAFT_1007434 [Pisolithus tinctorius Marx 270]